MDLHLAGKRIAVTGASKGIGLAVAKTLAEEGCDLVLIARNAEELQTRAGEIARNTGRRVDVVVADLSSEDEVRRTASEVGAIDILVNNAGAIPPGDLFAIDDAAWRKAWDLKVLGYIGLTRALYPAMKEVKGVIINIIGAGGENPDPDYIAGSTANIALMAFTKAMAKRAHRDGMRIVGINPGFIETDRARMMLEMRAEKMFQDRDRWKELTVQLPYGRAGLPAEIASAVAFLASGHSAYTNGAILTIDGGR